MASNQYRFGVLSWIAGVTAAQRRRRVRLLRAATVMCLSVVTVLSAVMLIGVVIASDIADRVWASAMLFICVTVAFACLEMMRALRRKSKELATGV